MIPDIPDPTPTHYSLTAYVERPVIDNQSKTIPGVLRFIRQNEDLLRSLFSEVLFFRGIIFQRYYFSEVLFFRGIIFQRNLFFRGIIFQRT